MRRNWWKWLLLVLALVALAVPLVVPPVAEALIVRQLRAFGVTVRPTLTLGYCWRNGPGVRGRLTVSVPGTQWAVESDYAASLGEWAVRVRLPETRFDERDPLVAMLLRRYPPAGVSNLVFSSSVALEARAERTFRKPLPVWKVRLPIRELSVSAMTADSPLAVEGLSVTLGASGIDDHVDLDPLRVRAQASTLMGLAVSNLCATVRATERALMISELTADFCGGRLSAYSVFLDPQRLNAGFTLFVDDLEAGQALGLLRGFDGEASGRLHGRLQAFVREGGRSVRLRDAFLYSTPGQTGKLRIADAAATADQLALTGLDEDSRTRLSTALADLDYSVLRFDLRRQEGNAARLGIHLRGTARHNGISIPVDLTVNLNGELEQLINTGLSCRFRGKE